MLIAAGIGLRVGIPAYRYDLDIDYRTEPVPPLPPRLAECADRLLKSKKLR